MPAGKPAGVRCIHLDANNLCLLFGLPERPAFCDEFRALPEVCGTTREEALSTIQWLEEATQPTRSK